MIEFDDTFGTDRLADPERKSGDHGRDGFCKNACLSLMARRHGAGEEYAVQEMLNYIDRLGLVEGRVEV